MPFYLTALDGQKKTTPALCSQILLSDGAQGTKRSIIT